MIWLFLVLALISYAFLARMAFMGSEAAVVAVLLIAVAFNWSHYRELSEQQQKVESTKEVQQ